MSRRSFFFISLRGGRGRPPRRARRHRCIQQRPERTRRGSASRLRYSCRTQGALHRLRIERQILAEILIRQRLVAADDLGCVIESSSEFASARRFWTFALTSPHPWPANDHLVLASAALLDRPSRSLLWPQLAGGLAVEMVSSSIDVEDRGFLVRPGLSPRRRPRRSEPVRPPRTS